MDRRTFLELFGIGSAVALVDPKTIITGSNTTVAPQAITEIAKQATNPSSVRLNQVLRVLANAKEGLDQGLRPDMTIKELLGKTPVAKTSPKTESKAPSSTGNDEALRREEIGRILAAIATPAQRLSSQIQSIASITE